ncbi:MAG: DUF945 domain-containing protein, partial [Nitrospira sp.]|nr:DUF945 domain-containing protein [Nitrospira sp.]
MIQVLEQLPSLRDKPNGRLEELQDLLADQARENHDIRTSADNLIVDESSGALLLRSLDFKPFKMRPLALSQLANRLSVPYGYIERCPAELAAENLNHWLRKEPDRKVMLRCRGDEVRAVLSARYYPIDNIDLIRWVSEVFGRDFPLRFEVTEESLDVQLLTEARHHVDRDDWLDSGLSIHNSEVGLRALEVRGMVYRQVCLNGLILYGKQQGYRRRHIGT